MALQSASELLLPVAALVGIIPDGSTRPWGWKAIITPVAMLRFLLNVTGNPLTEKLAVEKRGEVYRECQRTPRAFVPWFRKTFSSA